MNIPSSRATAAFIVPGMGSVALGLKPGASTTLALREFTRTARWLTLGEIEREGGGEVDLGADLVGYSVLSKFLPRAREPRLAPAP